MVGRLRDLQTSSTDVEASALVSVDGLIMASALPPDVEEFLQGTVAGIHHRHFMFGVNSHIDVANDKGDERTSRVSLRHRRAEQHVVNQ